MNWCIAFCRPNSHERVVDNCLYRFGIVAYVPKHRRAKQGASGALYLEAGLKPVFPGYVFVPMEFDWQKVSDLPDVSGFLIRNDKIVELPYTLIEDIQIEEILGSYDDTIPAVKKYVIGAVVRVEAGLLAGQVGVITSMKKKKVPTVAIGGYSANIPRKNLLLL